MKSWLFIWYIPIRKQIIFSYGPILQIYLTDKSTRISKFIASNATEIVKLKNHH
jgi:hypothetical protein